MPGKSVCRQKKRQVQGLAKTNWDQGLKELRQNQHQWEKRENFNLDGAMPNKRPTRECMEGGSLPKGERGGLQNHELPVTRKGGKYVVPLLETGGKGGTKKKYMQGNGQRVQRGSSVGRNISQKISWGGGV